MLGEVATAQEACEEARAALGEAIALLAEVRDEYEGARSQLALARLCISCGQFKEARDALERCTPVFERLDAALDLEAARALRREAN